MGFLLRVRISSFFAGAAAASVVGFCLVHKDYMVANEAICRQVRAIYETHDKRYEILNERIAALENLKKVETANPIEESE